jgi:nitroreductase
MSEIMAIIKARKSIRVYQEKPLPKKVVEEILEAARYAPTARDLQELEYKVITDKAFMSKLSDGLSDAIQKEGMPLKGPPGAKLDFFHGAPLVIIIAAPKDNYWASADAGLAVQNIMLFATSIKLGTCFIGMAKLIERDKNLMNMLHITDNMNIVAAVVCGYPAENPEPKEKKQTAEFFE